MSNTTKNKETFGNVLWLYRWLLIPAILILIIGILFCVIITKKFDSENALHPIISPVDYALKPVNSANEEDETHGFIIEESVPAEKSYFDDALFIGDSLTNGFPIYLSGDFTAIAVNGVNTHSAQTSKVFTTPDGQSLTFLETIEYYKPNKLYIMLGTNGLNWETIEWNYEGFLTLVDEIMMRVPGVTIIIQSCTPKTRSAASTVENYKPENICRYNDLLKDMCYQKGLYYLDIWSALIDSEGYMRDELAAADGIHMFQTGYNIWRDYIYNHTVQGNMSYSITDEGILYYVTQELEPIDPETTSLSSPEPDTPTEEQTDSDPEQ